MVKITRPIIAAGLALALSLTAPAPSSLEAADAPQDPQVKLHVRSLLLQANDLYAGKVMQYLTLRARSPEIEQMPNELLDAVIYATTALVSLLESIRDNCNIVRNAWGETMLAGTRCNSLDEDQRLLEHDLQTAKHQRGL